MEEKKVLKELLESGYTSMNIKFAGYEIYGRDNDRILYDPQTDIKIVEYKMGYEITKESQN